jgi:hypothetical protein
MSRTGLLILLGILIMLVPFSGLPVALRTLLSIIFGACVLGIGITVRARQAERAQISSETPVP